jgi:hypothetical protein
MGFFYHPTLGTKRRVRSGVGRGFLRFANDTLNTSVVALSAELLSGRVVNPVDVEVIHVATLAVPWPNGNLLEALVVWGFA